MTGEKIYFIINPNSKSSLGARIWRRIHRDLKAEHYLPGREYDYFFTDAPGDASRIARILTDPDLFTDPESRLLLFVVGGDGTLNEVMNGIRMESRQHIMIGYIPAGSGNDFYRGAGGIEPGQVISVIRGFCGLQPMDYASMQVVGPVKSIRNFICYII